jgi:CubicO group peptidase (beta-lactamase class C family)
MAITNFIFLIAAYAAMGQAQTDKQIVQRIDSLMSEVKKKDIFSGIILIGSGGKFIYRNSGGFADWKSKTMINDQTVFNIGSLTKKFTEEIIHQLVKEQRLQYSDAVNKYLQIFPPEVGSKITMQDLLDMKSGLGDYTQSAAFEKIKFTDYSVDDIMMIIKDECLAFEPGSKKKYSNSGYVILGAVIEKITGKSYHENLQSRIFLPMGISGHYSKKEKEAIKNKASGTVIKFDGSKLTRDDISNASPAGGLYMNIDNLFSFQEAIRNNKLPSGKTYNPSMIAGGNPYWNATIGSWHDYTISTLSNVGDMAEEVSGRVSSILKGNNPRPIQFPMEMQLYSMYKEKGMSYIEKNIEEIIKNSGTPYSPMFLNNYGLSFLRNNGADIAIALFELNSRLFPKDASAIDCLGEAYLVLGNKEKARIFSLKALELDPNYGYAKQRLGKL